MKHLFGSKYLLKITGLNVEKLLNNLLIWNIKIFYVKRTEKGEFFLQTDYKSYRKLLVKTAKLCYNINVEKITGIMSVLLFCKRRIALVCCFFACLITYFISLNFVWKIEIYGTSVINKGQVITQLQDCGVNIGTLLKNVKPSDIEKILYTNIGQIGLVSVTKKGSTIIINIEEKVNFLENDYIPLISQFDGVITEIKAVTGTVVVKVGDTVKKGDILVQPYYIGKNGMQNIRPVAEIYADIESVGSLQYTENQTEYVRTGKEFSFKGYNLFGKTFLKVKEVKIFETYEVSTEEVVPFKNWIFPIKIVKTTYHQTKPMQVFYGFEEKSQELKQKSIDLAYSNLPRDSQVLEEKTIVSNINDVYYITTYLKSKRRIDLGE